MAKNCLKPKKSFFFNIENSEIFKFYRRMTSVKLLNIGCWKALLNNKAKKEITLFPKTNYPISFKPFLLVQGVVVFVVVLFSFFALSNLFIPKPQIAGSQIIKNITVKQTSAIVANSQPVKWTILVKRSELKENQNFVQLPKSAKNIKVKTITKEEAETILAKTVPVASSQLTTKEREKLAKESSPKSSFFVASLFSKFSKFFLSSVEDAIDQIVETITQEVIVTEDAKLVDLSEQIIEEPAEQIVEQPTKQPASAESSGEAKEEKAEKQEEKEIKKENKKEQQEQTLSDEQPAEELEGPSFQELSDQELTSGVDETTPEVFTPEIEETSILETVSPSESPVIASDSEAISPIDQEIASSQAPRNDEEAETIEDEFVKIDYETPAPTITEQDTNTGKLVTVSSPTPEVSTPVYTDVLAYTNIPEIYKVGQESKIKIKWKNNDGQEMPFTAYDLNNNGKIDYIEWTVPHLSDQIFEIIFISKAFELDENQEIIADIYDLVAYQDNTWASVPNGHYVRVTFEQILDNTKDNTIYAKPADVGRLVTIEVYPVYTDQDGNQTEGPLVATFENIDHEDTYKVYLTNLQTPTDVFDLKIVSPSPTLGTISTAVEIDYIVDPSVSDPFTDETKIGTGTDKVVISGGQIILEECYAPDGAGWALAYDDTLVRNIAGAYNATIYKDIYCDDSNCILWTYDAAAPGTVCIATDADVYANILWAKTDVSGTQTWADSNFEITGGDIGGTHSTLGVGNNNVAIGTKNWLERYYTSTAGTFNAMDACKTKGLGWRLPTIVELDSIRDQAKGAAPYTRLNGIISDYYWSSSEYRSSNAYRLYFYNGYVYSNAKSTAYYVRCVRGQ